MPRVPTTIEGFLTFLDTHANLWDTNHAALGLSIGQTSAYKTLAGTAELNYINQVNQHELAKSATNKQQGTTASARAMTADLIRSISAYAQQQADPNAVYQLAQIDPPQPSAPAEPPGQPANFKAALIPGGSIKISWKAPNPSGLSGTVWVIRRQIAGETAYAPIGFTGSRSFTDATIPAGSAQVSYMINGQRGDSIGFPSDPFVLQFGVDGGGLTIAAQFTQTEKGKKAA